MAVRRVICDGPVTRRDRRSPARWLEYDRIIRTLVDGAVDRILDWGAGYGYVAARMRTAGLSPVSYEFVVDIDAELRFHPGVEVIVSDDPVRLPFADGEFEAVLSLATLQHVQDKNGSLRELYRVLQPGGRLYVFKLPNRLSWVEAAAAALGRPHIGDGHYPYDELYIRSSAVELIERNGFRVERFQRTNMLPLTLLDRIVPAPSAWLWRANTVFERVPGLNLLSTDFTLVATRVKDVGAEG